MLPKKPFNRVEKYLNYIARGGSNSTLPKTPFTRIEAYLDYIAKNGLGGGGGGEGGSISIDSVPTEGSNNAVSSGGVYSALQNVEVDVDSALSSTSENPVQNKVVKGALDEKQDMLTWDSAPVKNSTKPVTSGGVYDSIEALGLKVVQGRLCAVYNI